MCNYILVVCTQKHVQQTLTKLFNQLLSEICFRTLLMLLVKFAKLISQLSLPWYPKKSQKSIQIIKPLKTKNNFSIDWLHLSSSGKL